MIIQEFDVHLVYKDHEGELREESVSAIRDGEFYKLIGIPVFASNLACGDVVSVEDDNGKLYFFDLVRRCGNSTIHIALFDKNARLSITEVLDRLGCEYSNSYDTYLSVNIPFNADYPKVLLVIDTFARDGVLDFKEACIGSK